MNGELGTKMDERRSSLSSRLKALENLTPMSSTLDVQGTSIHRRTRKCEQRSKPAYPTRSNAAVPPFFGWSPGNSNKFSLRRHLSKGSRFKLGLSPESGICGSWRCQESGVFGSVRTSPLIFNVPNRVSAYQQTRQGFSSCFNVGNNTMLHPEMNSSPPSPHSHTHLASSIHH
ncbi:hypothetical protein CPC08DRAFT_323132 [Agrocybe pediades]|nr:hypothetical protein CPC08DRAFT_323132 [Agrocybe pediades]